MSGVGKTSSGTAPDFVRRALNTLCRKSPTTKQCRLVLLWPGRSLVAARRPAHLLFHSAQQSASITRQIHQHRTQRPQTTLTIGQRNIHSVIIYDDDRGKEFGNSAAIEVQAIARDDQAGFRDQQIPRGSLGSR